MNNNDILRRIRYILDLNDSKVMQAFELGGLTADRTKISDWLKKEEHPEYRALKDAGLSAFFNGVIIDRRGKKDGPPRAPEQRLTNNIVLTKLKIALDLKADEVIEIMNQGGLKLSKHELSAFFRKPGHKHYRECKDQCLRSFLKGLQLRYRE